MDYWNTDEVLSKIAGYLCRRLLLVNLSSSLWLYRLSECLDYVILERNRTFLASMYVALIVIKPDIWFQFDCIEPYFLKKKKTTVSTSTQWIFTSSFFILEHLINTVARAITRFFSSRFTHFTSYRIALLNTRYEDRRKMSNMAAFVINLPRVSRIRVLRYSARRSSYQIVRIGHFTDITSSSFSS